MLDQIIKDGQADAPRTTLLQRVAMPLFLFSVSLAVFLVLMKLLVLPSLTAMKLPGQTLSPEEVAPAKAQLQEELQSLERRRKEQLFGSDSLHAMLRREKQSDATVALLVDSILRVARETADAPAVILLQELSVDPDMQTITVRGDVRGAGAGSMTVLASFVDALGALDTVTVRDTSPFTREKDADGNVHSPFTMTLVFDVL